MNLTPSIVGGVGGNPNTIYPLGSTLQGYVDSSGNFQSRQIEYPLGVLQFGATSITQFPGGSLALFVAALDGVGRVITLSDYRPA